MRKILYNDEKTTYLYLEVKGLIIQCHVLPRSSRLLLAVGYLKFDCINFFNNSKVSNNFINIKSDYLNFVANYESGPMENQNLWLLNFARNVNSQTGEDGIIEKIFEIIPEKDRWCVEFGAWDGKHLSNTRNLIENRNYSAVLIEASKRKFKDLCITYKDKPQVFPINAFVGFTESDKLDVILQKTPIPKEFDFLSIDIEGNDYHVWNAMTVYRPKVVCIEYNPTIPNALEYVQPADMKCSFGNSPLSLKKLGAEKNYELIAMTGLNMIFVENKYFQPFHISDNSLPAMRPDESSVTFIFIRFDGTVVMRGSDYLPLHGVKILPKKLQQLPFFLRNNPSNYNILQRILFRLFRIWRNFFK